MEIAEAEAEGDRDKAEWADNAQRALEAPVFVRNADIVNRMNAACRAPRSSAPNAALP